MVRRPFELEVSHLNALRGLLPGITRVYSKCWALLSLNCRFVVEEARDPFLQISVWSRFGAKPETYELWGNAGKKKFPSKEQQLFLCTTTRSIHATWHIVNGYRSPCFNAFDSHTRKGFRLPNYSRSGHSAPPREFTMKPKKCKCRRNRSTKPQIPNLLRVLDWSGDL